MPKTYEPIQTQVLGSATATVTFSSIPQTYTDLVLVNLYATTVINEDAIMRFNSDSANNYSFTTLRGNGSAASSSRSSNISFIYLDVDSSGTTLSTGITTRTHIMNYSNTTTYKTTLGRSGTLGGSFGGGTTCIAGNWRNTAAITSISVTASGSTTFVTGSSFTLYGIKAA
jgi:hypothetical protein